MRTVAGGKFFPWTFNKKGSRLQDAVYGISESCVGLRCIPVQGVPVEVDGSNDVAGIDFFLARGHFIDGLIRDVATNKVIQGDVEVLDSTGKRVSIYASDWKLGKFRTGGLPPGDYTVRAIKRPFRSPLGEVSVTVTDADVTDIEVLTVSDRISGDGFEPLQIYGGLRDM